MKVRKRPASNPGNRRIILISNGKSFFLRNLKDILLKERYYVTDCMPKVPRLKECYENSDSFVLYLEDEYASDNEFLTFLKDICIEYDKRLHIVGTNEQLEWAARHLTDSAISTRFQRPLNVGDLLDALAQDALREGRKKILVVDDDPTFLRTVKGWLARKYAVTMANSGMNAVAYLAKHTPDLILLDYDIPITDGPKILEMIRGESETSEIPVIFLTGKSDRESVMKVMSMKPEGYLLKSMSSAQIIKAVDDFFTKEKNKDEFL
ncbi:MAG: response regulator [Eubacterium sp.]|nr:response regulator [Eubacterium sp.]